MEFFADLFVRFRTAVGIFLLAITVAATLGYILPAKTNHPLDKYNDDIEELEATAGEQVSGRFDLARSEAFLVVEVEDLFRPNTVAAVRAMVDDIRDLPYVETVFWLDEVPMLNAFSLAEPILPPDDASNAAFEQARDGVLNNPLVRGQLLSPDGTTLLMPITYDWLALTTVDMDEEVDEHVLVDGVKEAARASLAQRAGSGAEVADIRVRLTGDVPLMLAQVEAFESNRSFFQTLGYVLAFILSVLMFRGVAAVFVVCAAPMLSIYWSLGLIRLFGIESNPLGDVVMPVLISMIALTDSVHLLVHVRRKRLAGLEPIEACRSAIREVGLACWLTSLTTAIGFASLLMTETEYVRDFGAVCCFGVFVAFIAVVLFVPFICSTWIGRYVDRGHQNQFTDSLSHGFGRLVDSLVARRRVVALAAVAITLAFGVVSLQLSPDNRLASAMPSSSEAYQALAHCDRVVGGIEFVRLEVTWDESIKSESREVLSAIRDAEQVLGEEPLLEHPLSIRNLLATFPGDSEDLLTQASFLSLVPDTLRGFFFEPEKQQAVIVVRMQDRGIAAYTPVFDRVEAELADIAAETHLGFDFRLAGRPVEVSRDLYQIVTDLQWSLCTASVIILVVLSLAYRSLRVGLVSVVPNILPLVATGCLLVSMGQSLDMSSVCAFVVCLGIAVDDTVHFLSRFRREMVSDDDMPRSIHRAMSGVGSALVMTTVILVTGFGTMLFSDLPGHRTFAAMACATISSALIGDLLALPALLAVAWPSTAPPSGEEVAERS